MRRHSQASNRCNNRQVLWHDLVSNCITLHRNWDWRHFRQIFCVFLCVGSMSFWSLIGLCLLSLHNISHTDTFMFYSSCRLARNDKCKTKMIATATTMKQKQPQRGCWHTNIRSERKKATKAGKHQCHRHLILHTDRHSFTLYWLVSYSPQKTRWFYDMYSHCCCHCLSLFSAAHGLWSVLPIRRNTDLYHNLSSIWETVHKNKTISFLVHGIYAWILLTWSICGALTHDLLGCSSDEGISGWGTLV